MDQFEIVSVFSLEKYNEKEYATPSAVGFYDVNRLGDLWKRDLTPDEKDREKECYRFSFI